MAHIIIDTPELLEVSLYGETLRFTYVNGVFTAHGIHEEGDNPDDNQELITTLQAVIDWYGV